MGSFNRHPETDTSGGREVLGLLKDQVIVLLPEGFSASKSMLLTRASTFWHSRDHE
jgi:hypothetical protein